VRELAEPAGWNSAIVPQFPKLFENFKKKQFALLWRGIRDGFHTYDFHRRCDWYLNALTVILDTQGNIFAGFTPLKWELGKWNMRNNNKKADPSLKSFLFTLKNPHNISARRFALKAEKKVSAMCCRSDSGSIFCDIHVSGSCNTNTSSYTSLFGFCYTNDTGLNGKTLFTGSPDFQVREMEVFQIKDSITLPPDSACVLLQNCFSNCFLATLLPFQLMSWQRERETRGRDLSSFNVKAS
jgi:hypothetical protein